MHVRITLTIPQWCLHGQRKSRGCTGSYRVSPLLKVESDRTDPCHRQRRRETRSANNSSLSLQESWAASARLRTSKFTGDYPTPLIKENHDNWQEIFQQNDWSRKGSNNSPFPRSKIWCIVLGGQDSQVWLLLLNTCLPLYAAGKRYSFNCTFYFHPVKVTRHSISSTQFSKVGKVSRNAITGYGQDACGLRPWSYPQIAFILCGKPHRIRQCPNPRYNHCAVLTKRSEVFIISLYSFSNTHTRNHPLMQDSPLCKGETLF